MLELKNAKTAKIEYWLNEEERKEELKNERKVLIAIPVKDDLISLRKAVESIINNTFHPFKLLILDSNSTDGTGEYCDLLPKFYPKIDIQIIHKEESSIFSIIRAMNIALKEERDIYLTHSDTIHPRLEGRDWLNMMKKVSTIPEVGIVTSLEGGGKSGEDYLKGFTWVGTWSMYVPLKTLYKVGIFDENFKPGNGDDIDYSYRVAKAGFQIGIVTFCVDHHHIAAGKQDGRMILDKGLEDIEAHKEDLKREVERLMDEGEEL